MLYISSYEYTTKPQHVDNIFLHETGYYKIRFRNIASFHHNTVIFFIHDLLPRLQHEQQVQWYGARTAYTSSAFEFTPGHTWGSHWFIHSFLYRFVYISVVTCSIEHCIVSPSSNYGLRVPLWIFQTFH